ncbi:MAG: Hint domain-containing protein [Rhodobacter sp.]|nr:Hint domain-containing protein [Rhodobacter sp.]
MAIIYDMLELDGLPGVGDVIGQPGTGADVEFLMTETTADVPDDYFSTGLGQMIEAGFHVGSLGTFPADIDGTTYATNGLYDVTFDLGGTTYGGFVVQAIPTGGGPTRWFLIPDDGVSPLNINSVTIQSMNSVAFIDADDAAVDDTINFVVCFAAGTRIATPAGPRLVEELEQGDLVSTLDRGTLPILWAAETRVLPSDATAAEGLRVIEFAPGAIADAMPERQLRVSRQHRILLRSRIAERMFGEQEVLVAAKDLVALPGVRLAEPDEEVRFVHLLLPCHSVLLAEGVGAESLWLGKEAIRMLGAKAVLRARQALYAKQEPARPFVSGQRAQKLVERHLKNRLRLWDAAPLNRREVRRREYNQQAGW